MSGGHPPEPPHQLFPGSGGYFCPCGGLLSKYGSRNQAPRAPPRQRPWERPACSGQWQLSVSVVGSVPRMNPEASLQTGQHWGRGRAALAFRGAGPQTTEPEESPHSRLSYPLTPLRLLLLSPRRWGSRGPSSSDSSRRREETRGRLHPGPGPLNPSAQPPVQPRGSRAGRCPPQPQTHTLEG